MTKFLQKQGAKLLRWAFILLMHALTFRPRWVRNAGWNLSWWWRGKSWRISAWAYRRTNWLLGPWRLARRYPKEQLYLTGWLLNLQDEVFDLDSPTTGYHHVQDLLSELDELGYDLLNIEARIEVLENGAHEEVVDQLAIEEARVAHHNGGLAWHREAS